LIKLTDEQFKAIGRVAVAFAALEDVVPFLHILLIGADPRVAWEGEAEYQESITRGLERMREACRALAGDPLVAQVDAWVTEAFQARDRRVEIMHEPWLSEDPWSESEMLMKRLRGKGGQERITMFTAERINLIADQIDALDDEALIQLIGPLMSQRGHPLWRAKPDEWSQFPPPFPRPL